MKILVLSNKMPYPPKDGGSIASMNIILGLSQMGHDVHCLAMNTNKHPFPSSAVPEHIRALIHLETVSINTDLHPLGIIWNIFFSRQAYNAVRFRKKAFRRKLKDLLNRETFDLVQLEGPYPGYYLKTIRKYSKAKIALRAHNVEYLIWQQKARHTEKTIERLYLRILSRRLRKWETEIVNACDLLVPISPVDEACFRKTGFGGPALTIATGLSIEDYPLSPLPEGREIFFIGALDWLPNQEGIRWFIEKVFRGLTERIPELLFHIAGRNAPPSFVEKLQHKNIRFHGEIENAQAFMRDHSIMIAPLLTGSGIRIKILEALAMGRPVLTTSKGAEGIDARHEKELLIADTPEDFGQQCLKLIENRELCLSIAEKGRVLVREKFDTFALSTRLSRFYETQA
ncbi:MAG: hypothetical protein CSA96_09260 [Bacteroidetes bacterium]|nr:MAG: hypothetical protein CSA96_09260 [Bacteroidota bacterium]